MSYHHGGDGGRNSFERSITLEGNLVDDERAQLMQAAKMCPVGRTLGLSADIRTNDNVSVGRGGKLWRRLERTSDPEHRPRLACREIVRERHGVVALGVVRAVFLALRHLWS